MHLMFSERVINSNTQSLSEDRFFKRNGAKKDREWTTTEKLVEVREKWVETMNAAMERQGHEQRLDHRSWEAQGRHDLAELVEPKLLGGNEAEARALHAHVDRLREQRAELPAPGLSVEVVADKIEERAEQKVAEVREREAQELSRLDKLIAAAREMAAEVKEHVEAVSQHVSDGLEKFRARFDKWREERGESPEVRQEGKAAASARQERAGPEIVPADIEGRQRAFRERYAAHQKDREPVFVVKQDPPPEQKVEQSQEKEQKQQVRHDFGIGR